MDISQVKERKKEICEEIADKIRKFEKDTETKLTYISLIRKEVLGSDYGKLVGVEVQIELW